ncbi:MAG: DUF433 domain-containing protein [Spirochaetaceae bacterium]|nr:DUF433 domain-containing protein [Spirochaetaceae bacterium]
MQLGDAVWIDPARMSGAPCFRGTRIPVSHLFDWIDDGVPLDDFISEFEVNRDAALAVLRYGRRVTNLTTLP